MAINEDDVKVLESQRLTDEDDGGGRATGRAVVSNQMNNLFSNISRLDRTIGRINLRKAFAGVVTENADPYLGVHAIVSEPPTDPRVSVLLFDSGSQTDERLQAQQQIEGYVVPSVIARWELLGDQYAGQRGIVGVQHLIEPVPRVGDVYLLTTGAQQQFVRLTEVDATEAEYIVQRPGSGDVVAVTRRRLDMKISSRLLATYPGGAVTITGTNVVNLNNQSKAVVRETQVADSARYFGLSRLAQAVTAGSLELTVTSVYSQLVPSAMREQALLSMLAGGLQRDMVETTVTPRSISLQFGRVAGTHSRAFVPTGVSLKGCTLTIEGGVFSDVGSGNFSHQSGANSYDRIEIDHETGQVDVYRTTGFFTGTATLQYTPATARIGTVVSSGIDVTLGNRGFVYTLDLSQQLPRPGSLVVSYMVMGKWYELRDNGAGSLQGQGSGAVSYVSGAASVTLSALPDVGTRIIYSYISQLADNIQIRDGGGPAVTRQTLYRTSEPPDPASVTVTVTVGGVPVGVGATVVRDTVYINELPDPATDMLIEYTPAGRYVSTPLTGGVPDGAGVLTGTIPDAPLQPGTVVMDWFVQQVPPVPSGQQSAGPSIAVPRRAVDDGSGGWNGFVGMINYTTGVFTLQVIGSYERTVYTTALELQGTSWRNKTRAQTQTLNEHFGGTLTVTAVGA